MAIKKSCRQCNSEFTIEDADLEFYKKISPTFAGKTFEIPPPTLCPECRSQRRMVWRNEKKLYKRKSDLSQKEIISTLSPDKPYKVYDQDEWWSDKWDAMEYGLDYNSNKSFFEQYHDLYEKVPKINLINVNHENSDFLSFARGNKNSYLLFSAIDNEDCFYSTNIDNCKSCVDCLLLVQCTSCYEAIESQDCFNCQHIQECRECSDCSNLYDCKECDHCLFCSGLRRKSYHAFNKPIEKEEYTKLLEKIHAPENLARFKIILGNTPRRCAKILKSEDVTGDNISNCKNCRNIFDTYGCEDCAYLIRSVKCNSTLDCNYTMANYCLEGLDIDENGNRNLYALSCWSSNDILYSTNCHASNNLFGCAGLRHKQYCILNKQYSKDEYEKITANIIEKMQKDGEWGEYFPVSLAPFGYNETVANEYFPLDKEGASKLEAKWQDNDFSPKYEGPYIEPKNIDEYIKSAEEAEKLLSGVIKCEVSGKPFKLMPQEFKFYIENKIPIPTKHYDVRHAERFNKRNPLKLYKRECMCEESGHSHEGRCKNEFETTYAPDRKERVYCESCYQKTVI